MSQSVTGPARSYCVLARQTDEPFSPSSICLFNPPDSPDSICLLIFSSPAAAVPWERRLKADGVHPHLVALPTADLLTDMLADMRTRGVSHVALDPDLDATDRIPIASAIVRFGLC